MTSLLRHRDFRLLFLGYTLSAVGDRALLLALGIWTKELTGSNAAAAVTFLLVALPQLAAPLTGALADRFPRRRVLIANDLATGALLLSLLFVQSAGDVWILQAAALVYGISAQLGSAARSGLVATMLPAELLAPANGVLEAVRAGVRIVGPLAGAALFTLAGGSAVALLDIGTFALSAAALLAVRCADIAPQRAALAGLDALAAGARHVGRTPELRLLVPVMLLAGAAIGLSEVVPFALVDDGLHRPAAFLGVIATIQGFGAVAGALLAPRVARATSELSTITGALALSGAGMALQAIPTVGTVIIGATLLVGGLSATIVAYITLVQRVTPSGVQGRVFAACEALFAVPYTLSIGLGAIAIRSVDYRVLCLLGCAALLSVALSLLPSRRAALSTSG